MRRTGGVVGRAGCVVVAAVVAAGAATARAAPTEPSPRGPVLTVAARTTTTTTTPTTPRLRVDVGRAVTGKIVVVTLRAAPADGAVAAVTATLGPRRGVALPVDGDRRTWRVLLPVEIDEPARRLPLVMDVRLADGDVASVRRDVRVHPGRYERRSISVGRQFTSPSAEQQARAAAEARALEEALATTSPERLWRGSFRKPTAGPPTSPFGTLRTYNKKRRSRHLGLDLDGDVGAPVAAANSGRVLLAAERFYSGGTVVLDHGQGFFTMYFHLSRIDVVPGQFVDRGGGLGAVGATGQVTGPHLHFVARLGGCSVDPAQLLALALADDTDVPVVVATPAPIAGEPGSAAER